MNKISLVIGLISVGFIACGKTSFEVESPEERMDRQIELLQKAAARIQVKEFSLYSDHFSISFTSGETFRLSLEGTPVFSMGERNDWLVNGIKTGKMAQFEGDTAIIPEISINEGGNWIVDGTETAISAHSVLTPEDLEMSYISHIVSANDWLHIFLYDGDPIHVPVVEDPFYQVPLYFMDSLTKKEVLAEEAITEADGNCTSFVFITDTHWGKNMKRSPALIRHIIDYTSLDDVIFGGDVVTSHHTNLVTPMETGKDFQQSFSFLGTRFHCLYGNHDNNSDSQKKKTEYHLSEEQVFSFLQSQMTDVTFGNYYNFYYDNPATKTRIIGLDTGRYYYSEFRDKLPETVQFAIEALNSMPAGWHAIMASHIWCSSKKQSDGTYKQYIEGFMKQVLDVFDAYNDRLAGQYKYNNTIVPYDFSTAEGRIDFCIGGHTHANFTTSSERGIPVIIVISDYSANPQKGTDKEQSVTIAVSDYKNRQLNLFVVGRGADRIINL